MNFEEYWQGTFKGGLVETDIAVVRSIAASAWDAALCSIQSKAFDSKGEMATASALLDMLSDAHTYNTKGPTS